METVYIPCINYYHLLCFSLWIRTHVRSQGQQSGEEW